MKILSKQDFNKNEAKNFVIDNLSSAPSNPILGQIYYNTKDERAYACIKAGDTPEWADLSLQEEVSIGEEEPNGRDVKIWINPEDMTFSGRYESLPLGSIIPFPGEIAPEGFSICDGKELNRGAYKQLFQLIGTAYGEGDGSTTFNIPNIKGKIVVGLDNSDDDFNTLGKTGGEKEHTLTVEEMPKHNHAGGILTNNQIAGGARYYFQSTGATNGTNFSNSLNIGETGEGKAHNNVQPYIVLNYIIKASTTTPTQGEIIDSLDGNSTTNAPSVRAVNEKITNVENKFEWLLVGKTTGTTKLQLPETFNELYVETNVNGVNLLFNIPRATLSTTEKPFYNGYYFVAENSRAVMIQATTTQIHLSVAYDNLGDKTGTSTMNVYYR